MMSNKLLDKTTFKFILVGIVNTIVGTLIMFCCYNLFGFSYWVSSATNYALGSILSFILNKYYTFRNSENSIIQVVKFVVNILVCYFVAYGIAKPLVFSVLSGYSISIQENVAMFTGMCLFTVLNYIGQRFFAFRS